MKYFMGVNPPPCLVENVCEIIENLKMLLKLMKPIVLNLPPLHWCMKYYC